MDGSQAFSDQAGRLPKKETVRLADIILNKEKQALPVNIVLTDDNSLRRLNRRFRGNKRTTDVLAFPADPDEGVLGEIYISIDAARRQAKEYNITLREETLRLVSHGTLHLCGYDHRTAKQAARMRKREEGYLKRFLKHD